MQPSPLTARKVQTLDDRGRGILKMQAIRKSGDYKLFCTAPNF